MCLTPIIRVPSHHGLRNSWSPTHCKSHGFNSCPGVADGCDNIHRRIHTRTSVVSAGLLIALTSVLALPNNPKPRNPKPKTLNLKP